MSYSLARSPCVCRGRRIHTVWGGFKILILHSHLQRIIPVGWERVILSGPDKYDCQVALDKNGVLVVRNLEGPDGTWVAGWLIQSLTPWPSGWLDRSTSQRFGRWPPAKSICLVWDSWTPLGGRRFSQRLYILLGLELALAGISTMLWAWAFGSFWHI